MWLFHQFTSPMLMWTNFIPSTGFSDWKRVWTHVRIAAKLFLAFSMAFLFLIKRMVPLVAYSPMIDRPTYFQKFIWAEKFSSIYLFLCSSTIANGSSCVIFIDRCFSLSLYISLSISLASIFLFAEIISSDLTMD